SSNCPSLLINSLSEQEIYSALRNMKNTTTAGQDGIPSFLLRDLQVFSLSHCQLFSIYLSNLGCILPFGKNPISVPFTKKETDMRLKVTGL
ncbi:hypothetical protein, partial [Enterobacter cloacae complex sp. 2DZ2F20B]|uniref:hypothetical protein n=1 Tax=Enterobacter cloacae complex sp. 2DZ2F20B TaxID=2511993 RepID=UPI001CA4DBDB